MLDTQVKFHVRLRKKFGKTTKSLKREGYVLANLYGLNQPSLAIQMKKTELQRLFAGNFDSGLVYIEVEGETSATPVLVDQVAKHPVSGEIQHVVLRRVNLKKEIEIEVKIKPVGSCEIVDATVVLVTDFVTIKTVPSNIPELIEVDISGLSEVGQSITLSQLILPENIKLVIDEDTKDNPVVMLQTTKVEEPVEEVAPVVQAEPVADQTETAANAEDKSPATPKPAGQSKDKGDKK